MGINTPSSISFGLFCAILLLGGLAQIQSGSGSSFEVASPWAWVCNSTNSICLKQEKTMTGNGQGATMAQCKLTCDPVAMLWPKPTGLTNFPSKAIVNILASNIKFTKLSTISPQTDGLIREATDLFTTQISNMGPQKPPNSQPSSYRKSYKAADQQVNIEVAITSGEFIPTLETDESYSLSISTASTTTSVYITAATFFGARHALETLSQLIIWDDELGTLQMVSDASIEDAPVFPHRGLLVDTARNYIPVSVIKKILDGMAYNKLNVFHWHIVDSQSFPFVSTRQPLMALYGAYSPSEIYTPTDIQDIVHYATVRGIKVIPELDAPSHVGSGWQWGPKYNLGDLTLCFNIQPWDQYCAEPPCGIFNPINENLYPILNDLYKDMFDLFPSDIFHMGGDEVNMACWNETAEILAWMSANGYNKDFLRFWSYYQNRSLNELDQVWGGKQSVVLWTNSFTESMKAENYLDPNRYIIQVWTEFNDSSIKDMYQKNFRLIMSNTDAWYFDCGFGAWVGLGSNRNNWCSPYKGWQTVYANSPRKIITDFGLSFSSKQALGGEAAIWVENTSPMSIESKLWPRGAALAERLWSDPDALTFETEYRMVHQSQRLMDRGIGADAIQPEWCRQNQGTCNL